MPGIETTAPDRTDTSSGSLRVAQPLADALLERRQVLAQLVVQAVRVAAVVRAGTPGRPRW